jgi:hypothetical protein
MLWKPAFMKAETHKNYPKSTIARMLRGTKEEQHYRHVFSALKALFSDKGRSAIFLRTSRQQF